MSPKPDEKPSPASSASTPASVLITEGPREAWRLLLLVSVFAAMRSQREVDGQPEQARRAGLAIRSYLRELGPGVITLIAATSAGGGLGSWLLSLVWGSSTWAGLATAVVITVAAALVFNVGLAIQEEPDLRARLRASLARLSVRGLTSLAAFLAGSEGPALLDESDGHLAGWSGHDPAS